MPILTTLSSAPLRVWGWAKSRITGGTNLWTTGLNVNGQLGNGATDNSISLTKTTLKTWRSVAVGPGHTIAVSADGTLWAWGLNNSGQLGLGNTTNYSFPQQVGALTTWVRAYANGSLTTSSYSIAVKSDNTAWSWGYGANGTLGQGSTTSVSSPVTVGGSLSWSGVSQQASAGPDSVIMVTTAGTMYAWGKNQFGQLGQGTTSVNATSTPTAIAGTWLAASSGAQAMSAIKSTGTLWTWGKNTLGQLGLGDTTNRSSPVQVTLGTAYQAWNMVTMGFDSAMGVVYSGTTEATATRQTWSWGNNNVGQLGLGNTTNASAPVQVITSSPVSQLSMSTFIASGSMIQGLYDTATLWSWGNNNVGQLGLDDTTNRSSPVQVSIGGVSTDWSITNTGGASTMALYGQAYKFFGSGTNSATAYQLGLGTTGNVSNMTQIGTANKLWKSIRGQPNCQFALGYDNTLWAWGNNNNGRLGLGDTTTRSTPVQVGTLTNWNLPGPTTNGNALAVVKTDGTLWVWGVNSGGQLGLGDTTDRSSPVQVGTLNTWKYAIMAQNVMCAIKTDGTLWTWGTNAQGALGQGSTTPYSSPKQVGILTNWNSAFADQQNISAPGGSISVVKSNGTLWTWGAGASGQMGLGSTANISSPQQVGALTNWMTLGCSSGSVLALKQDGSLWAWGINTNGQLGQNDITSRSSPTQIGTKLNWYAIATTPNASSGAIDKDHKLWLWGLNSSGQLAQGSTIFGISSPVQVGGATNWYSISGGTASIIAGQQ
jgi:alpha-tubulin suppressor-like RCC1 family protein